MQRKQDFYRYIARIVRREVLEILTRKDTCIFTTRCLLEVFKILGYKSAPLPVSVLICNAAFIEQSELQQRYPEPEEVPIWREQYGAYNVGVGFGAPVDDKSYPGHLVVILQDGAETFLVDGSIDQANRPQYNIGFDAIVLPADLTPMNDISQEVIASDRINGCEVAYFNRLASELSQGVAFEQSPDWRALTAIHQVVNATLQVLDRRSGRNVEISKV